MGTAIGAACKRHWPTRARVTVTLEDPAQAPVRFDVDGVVVVWEPGRGLMLEGWIGEPPENLRGPMEVADDGNKM